MGINVHSILTAKKKIELSYQKTGDKPWRQRTQISESFGSGIKY